MPSKQKKTNESSVADAASAEDSMDVWVKLGKLSEAESAEEDDIARRIREGNETVRKPPFSASYPSWLFK